MQRRWEGRGGEGGGGGEELAAREGYHPPPIHTHAMSHQVKGHAA